MYTRTMSSDEAQDVKAEDPRNPQYIEEQANLKVAEARRQLVILVADIGWLIGAADQAGIVAPAKIHDHLEAAVTYLGAVRT